MIEWGIIIKGQLDYIFERMRRELNLVVWLAPNLGYKRTRDMVDEVDVTFFNNIIVIHNVEERFLISSSTAYYV